MYRRGCLRDIAFAHYEFVAREVYLEEVRDTDVSAHIAVAVYRHQPLAVEVLEEHAMTEVGWGDGLRLLNPWSVKGTALGVSYTLSIYIVYPTCPYHAEASGSSTEEPWTIGYAIGDILAIYLLATPW